MLGAGRLRARGAKRGERVGPVAREGEREWAARERLEAWAQARGLLGRAEREMGCGLGCGFGCWAGFAFSISNSNKV